MCAFLVTRVEDHIMHKIIHVIKNKQMNRNIICVWFIFHSRNPGIQDDSGSGGDPKPAVDCSECRKCKDLQEKMSTSSDWRKSFDDIVSHVSKWHDCCDFLEVSMPDGCLFSARLRLNLNCMQSPVSCFFINLYPANKIWMIYSNQPVQKVYINLDSRSVT